MSVGHLSRHVGRSLTTPARRPRCGAQTTFGTLSAIIGIARPADLATYLAHVSHDQITSIGFRRPTVVRHASGGSTTAARPGDQPFWLATASGSGTQTLRFEFPGRDWTAVVMNADGTPGLAVVADRATTVPSLRSIAIGGLAGGVLLLAIGLVFTATGDRVPARPSTRPKGA